MAPVPLFSENGDFGTSPIFIGTLIPNMERRDVNYNRNYEISCRLLGEGDKVPVAIESVGTIQIHALQIVRDSQLQP